MAETNRLSKDVAERTLVQKIMKGIQAVHDQEIAKLKNELHRKDGLIASLEDIKTTLENSLRKKLQVKGIKYVILTILKMERKNHLRSGLRFLRLPSLSTGPPHRPFILHLQHTQESR